ncbi:MAG: ABC transporter permease [Candidatus Aminicenantes bacterium]|nr:MAG: ABC transporter permease [Candidatus Aminicenantes bacterium]
MNKNRRKIPKIPFWFLKQIYSFDSADAYSGDIEEEFAEIQKCQGRTKAKRWIWSHAIAAIPRWGHHLVTWRTTMFKNYFKIALRNFLRHLGYTFINVAGLAIGITCCILIMLWVQDELSFDRFHENADDLYVATFSNGSKVTPTALSGFLKTEYPEIILTSRYSAQGRDLLKYEDTDIYQEGGVMVDPDFLNMFTLPLLKGNPEIALDDPNSILLSEQVAKKLFDTSDPLGQILTYNTRVDLKVTGVFEDYPSNSHMQFQYILPLELAKIHNRNLNTWEVNNIRTYVQLRKNTPVEDVDAKITDVVERHRPQDKRSMSLQPITRVHLNPYHHSGGAILYVYLFSAMAFFILLIACINFINLTTARSSNRAREVGIRKTVGAFRSHLIRQFFSESIVLTMIASGLAMGLVFFFLPMFNSLTGKTFTWELLIQQAVVAGIFVIIFLTVILAGSYPSLVLSRFQPVNVLKGGRLTGAKGSLFRKVLVVLQFSLSIFLILGTLMIFRQVHYLRAHDVGYDRENIVYFGIGSRFRQNYDTIKTALLSHSNIQNVTLTDIAPYRWQSNAGYGDVHWEGKTNQQVKMVMMNVDYDYLDTFGLTMAQGRFFSQDYSTDASDAYVVNQAAVRAMEMDDPIGKELKVWDLNKRIIGVVQDYHFESLHNEIIPMAMRIDPNWHNQACVRISPYRIPDTLAFLESKWKEIYPEYPFEYRFLDDTIANQYRSEQAIGRIVTVFTILALFISCLGIFGLSSYTAEQRTKEIGIRKVLGATVSSIIRHISKEFVVLIVIANVIIWPLAYFAQSRWLQTFAYRINIGWWTFILTGIVVLVLSLLTVSWQIIRAATANPVDSLRYE